MTGPLPPVGICPSCAQVAGGERCTHCGVAVRVGPYRVRQVLGQRGAARTYLADDTDGLIVLKELSFSTEPTPATLQAFHQEARQLQTLTHPRIPRYLDLLQLGLGAETRLYLVQEFIEGTPLETELSSRPSTELEARELARHVLDLLGYLQSRSPQVFHGDLKPANLIRRPDGALFLVDFGAGWVRGRASPEPSHYTPPEQTHGELDSTTDLFALGVTLFEALSWESQRKAHRIGPEDLASRVDVSTGFRQFLTRLTSVNPKLRFASAHEALQALEHPERTPASSLRRRGTPVALGIGAGLLLFGAGVLTGRVTRPAPVTAHRLAPVSEPCTVEQPPVPGNGGETLINPPAPRTEVRETWVPLHEPPACDYALTGAVNASSSSSRTTAQDAFDHDKATYWRNAQLDGAWLQVDLGDNRLIDGVVVDWAWDTGFGQTAKGTLMTSVDGSHWSYLHALTHTSDKNDVPRRLEFPQRVARYVLFRGSTWHEGGVRVRSLEVYGPDCPLPE